MQFLCGTADHKGAITMRSDLIYIPDSELDALIQQDTPYLDLTTLGLDIGDEPGSLSFYTREPCVLCCTEEVSRILSKLGLSTAIVEERSWGGTFPPPIPFPPAHKSEPASCSSPQRAASVTCTVRGRSVSPCFPTVPALPPKPETCSIGYRKFPLPFP